MFYIKSLLNKTNTSRDVFHDPKIKIIPKVVNDKLEVYCELYLYANLIIPNNSLLLDIKTNFGNFSNIPLNTNYDHSKNYDLYFEHKFYFNLSDNKELSNKIHENTPLEFLPTFSIDKNAFNNANLTPSADNVDYFIKKISLINKDQLSKEQYYYSNYYSLHNLSIKNIKTNEINKPEIEVPIFNKTLNYHYWTNFTDFINFYFLNNQKSKIEWLELKMDYYLYEKSNSKKSFSYKYQENNFWDKLNKDSLYTDFDYIKNEIILSDKINGYKGIFIPYCSNGNIKLSFKINSITYYQNFDFNLSQNLFGDNAKFQIKLNSYEQS